MIVNIICTCVGMFLFCWEILISLNLFADPCLHKWILNIRWGQNIKAFLLHALNNRICSFCHMWGLSPNGCMFLVAGWRRNISWLAQMVLTGMYWSWNRLWYSVMTMSTILLRFWTKFSQKLVTKGSVKIQTCVVLTLTL